MANLLFDGFEGLTAAYVRSKWAAATGGSGSWNVSATARPGGSAQAIGASSALSAFRRRAIGANVAHVFTGVGVLFATQPAGTDCSVVLYDGTTAQVGWRRNSDGSISVYRGVNSAATLIGTTAAGVLPLGSVAADYKMPELEVIFATGATGEVRLKVAGVQVLEVLTVQTSNTANAYCNGVEIRMSSGGANNERFDDFYLNDNTGSAPHNTFYGEAFVVEKIGPSGNGTYSEFTGSDGNSTDNYLLVDDTGNDDTDYVASGTLNQRDTYALSNLTNATGTVIGIEQHFVARKDDVASRAVAPMVRTGGSDFVGTPQTMTGSYALYSERRLLNPDTGLAWSIADINALEAGVKVTT